MSHRHLARGRVFCAALLLAFLAVSAQAEPTMRIHYIDVGQGSATLLEFSCAAVLIDTGGEENDEQHGTEALIGYLDEFFALRPDLSRRLKSLMLTHPHKDHTLGAKRVIAEYQPMNAVTNGQDYGSGKDGQIALHRYALGLDHLDGTADDIPYQFVRLEDLPAHQGMTDPIIDPVACQDVDPKIDVLWGRISTPRPWSDDDYRNNNNHSLAIRVRFGQAAALWTGDMEQKALTEFVARYANTQELDVDVYEAGHHGSLNGTTQALMNAMTPKISVISMGPSDRQLQWTAWQYGHPRREIVAMLQNSAQGARPVIHVSLGKGGKKFVPGDITRSVFATGWDGDVVLETNTAGNWRVIKPFVGQPRLDINVATVQQLLDLPGIGGTKANAIVAYRNQHGRFTQIRDLDKVDGIGPVTIAALEPYVIVSNSP